MQKLHKDDLDKIKQAHKETERNWVKVGMSSCGVAAGAQEVLDTLRDEAKKRKIDLEIKQCGCQGMCSVEPLVEVHVQGLPNVIYGRVNKESAVKILDKHICEKTLVKDLICELRTKK